MKNKYDIIIIGGGHNGLTAAAIMAGKGKKVLLLEKRPILGGIAAGEEFHPGYKTNGLLHDTSCVRTGLIQGLKLEQFGLAIEPNRPTIALLSKAGEVLHLSADVKEAAAEIARVSKKDAEAYLEYRAFIDQIKGFVQSLVNEIPPDLVNLGTSDILTLGKKGFALKRLGKKTMLEFMKVAPMSVADFLDEKFETDFLKAGLAGPSIYASYTGPLASYTTLNLLLWECCAKVNVKEGAQALVMALEKAARAAGVEIRTNAAVEKILLNDHGVVEGIRIMGGEEVSSAIVASSCTPKETFFNLLAANEIEYPLENSIRHYRSRGTTAKINLALNKTLAFKGSSDRSIEFARTGNSILEMEKAFDSIKYRQFSNEPILDVHIPSVSDPSLAPEGHSVVSILVHFAPYHFDAGWNEEQKEKLSEAVLSTLEQYAPDVRKLLVAQEVLSPLDLETRYGLTNGHIYHGEHAVDQMITRPIPSCARYATPIPGLYLCGSGAHPGGGITCGPGALGAQMILKSA